MSDTHVDEIVENESVEEAAAAVDPAVSEETTEATSTDTAEDVEATAAAEEVLNQMKMQNQLKSAY